MPDILTHDFNQIIREFYPKQIHFHEYVDMLEGLGYCYDCYSTYQAIKDNRREIHTTQFIFLSTSLFDSNYQIFIHEKNGDVYEIKLGPNNTRTNRDIKKSHNLLKLWQNGEFEKEKC